MRWFQCPCTYGWAAFPAASMDRVVQSIHVANGRCTGCKGEVGDFKRSYAEPPQVLRAATAQAVRAQMKRASGLRYRTGT